MELKILADFLINCLIFCKESLKQTNVEHTAELINVMWNTMNFLGCEEEIHQEDGAVHKRYKSL